MQERALCESWLANARDAGVAFAIAEIHALIASEIEARRPVCTASGRCCRFEGFGHRLYVTGLEAALTLDTIPAERALGAGDIERALAEGVCPFAAGNLCGVHPARPAGCRVYFCDSSAQLWVNELAERASGMVKAVHERFAIDYRYGEWRAMLGMFQRSGVALVPSRPAAYEARDPFVPITSGRA